MMKFAVLFWFVSIFVFFSFRLSYSSTALTDSLKILAIRVEFQPDNSENTTGNGTFDLSQSTDPAIQKNIPSSHPYTIFRPI